MCVCDMSLLGCSGWAYSEAVSVEVMMVQLKLTEDIVECCTKQLPGQGCAIPFYEQGFWLTTPTAKYDTIAFTG